MIPEESRDQNTMGRNDNVSEFWWMPQDAMFRIPAGFVDTRTCFSRMHISSCKRLQRFVQV
jgi:hypothetical protein